MKIISINVAGRSNFGKNYQERIEKIAKMLEKEQADVVCMQEVTFNETESLAEKINGLLNHPYSFCIAQMSEKYTFDKFSKAAMEKFKAGLTEHVGNYLTDGMAILSKIPIANSSTIVMKPAPADERGKPDLRVRIVQNIKLDSGITISNVHLVTNNNAYMQLQELLDYRKSDIIVGDFNMSTDDIKKHANIWKDSYSESTDFENYVSFPSEDATFDHMLLSPKFHFESIRTIDGLSDHSAIVFELN